MAEGGPGGALGTTFLKWVRGHLRLMPPFLEMPREAISMSLSFSSPASANRTFCSDGNVL